MPGSAQKAKPKEKARLAEATATTVACRGIMHESALKEEARKGLQANPMAKANLGGHPRGRGRPKEVAGQVELGRERAPTV